MHNTLFLGLAVVVLGGVISGFVQTNHSTLPPPQAEQAAMPSAAAIEVAKKALEQERQVKGTPSVKAALR